MNILAHVSLWTCVWALLWGLVWSVGMYSSSPLEEVAKLPYSFISAWDKRLVSACYESSPDVTVELEEPSPLKWETEGKW